MFEILLPYLIGSIAFNLTLFIVAYKLQSDKLTDISYALTFIAIAGAAFAANIATPYKVMLLISLLLWSLRIGGFLLLRVIRSGKDARFDEMRSDFWKFGRFWLLQGISVWILMIPSTLAFYADSSTLGIVSCVGLAIFAAGLIIETIADYQKATFNRTPERKGRWIDIGLWRYSRHPNYFGEILVWIGVYMYAAPSLELSATLVALISPLFIGTLLVFVSGIPILEKSADKRWGDDIRYQQYKQQTSILIPWYPSRNKASFESAAKIHED